MSDETQIIIPPRAPLTATGGTVVSIIPQTMEDMYRLATAFYKSGLTPSSYKNAEQVLVAIMAGSELGFAPYQAVQAFYVANQRAVLWGDAVPALLWTNGFKIKEWYENSAPSYPDEMVANCLITRPSGDEIAGEFSVADAKEAGLWTKTGPWQTSKKRMMKMRARAFGARDGASDVLKGMQIREEIEDYGEFVPSTAAIESPKGSGLAARLADQTQKADTGFNAEGVAKETGGDKPRRASRRAATAAPSNDAAPSAEAPDASQDAAETVDQETGEIIDAQVEEIEQKDDTVDDDFPGDRPTKTASAPTADAGHGSAGSATDASTGSAEETSGPSDTGKPLDDGAPVSDAPYTEMAEAINRAAHWDGIKQALRSYAKTKHWADESFKLAARQTGWRRFKHLQDEGVEDTEVFSEANLMKMWLEFGATSADAIDTMWAPFWRGAFKQLPEAEQKAINNYRIQRKGELA